jgi:hypothetical protein
MLVQEILLEGGKSTLVESGIGAPTVDVRVELRPALYGSQEVFDASKFEDIVSGTGKKLIILSHKAAEVAEIGEEYNGAA